MSLGISMETDILVLTGKYRRLDSESKVRVDLSELTLNQLFHLKSGVESALEARRRNYLTGRCWEVPPEAVEVFIEVAK